MVNTAEFLYLFSSAIPHVEKDGYLGRTHIRGFKSPMSLVLKNAFKCVLWLLIQPGKTNKYRTKVHILNQIQMQTWDPLKIPCMLLVTELAQIDVISDTCSEDWLVCLCFSCICRGVKEELKRKEVKNPTLQL